MKKALQGIISLLFLAIVIFSLLQWQRGISPGITSGSSAPPAAEDAKEKPKSTPTKITPLPPAPANVSQTFMEFLATEARSLDAPHVDAGAANARVAAQAATMSDAEVLYARDLVLSDAAPANQRIFSTYLLTKGGAKTRSALEDIILAPTSSDRAAPSSIEELKNTTTKANAITAIDALASDAVTSLGARDRLIKLAAKVKDPTIQSYIYQVIRRLPPL